MMPWRTMAETPPENETIEFLTGTGDDVDVISGWCSLRFLGGIPTYWGRANPDGRPEIVFPRRWRMLAASDAMADADVLFGMDRREAAE